MKTQFTRCDLLAQDRTHLANERTLLAYWRTALACLVLGVFLMRFTTHAGLIILATAAVLLAVVLFVIGIIRFRQNRSKIDSR